MAYRQRGRPRQLPTQPPSCPRHARSIVDSSCGLTLIACHYGGYHLLEEAEEQIVGWRAILGHLLAADRRRPAGGRIRTVIERHGADQVVFGSDWPMTDPAAEIAAIRALGLSQKQALDAAQFSSLPYFLGSDLRDGTAGFFDKRPLSRQTIEAREERISDVDTAPEVHPMNIVVLVKHVPAASAARRFTADSTVDRVTVPGLLSELDEYAVEQALQVVESGVTGQIMYLTMGPAAAADALRKALTMGGDGAVHVSDEALHGTDAAGTSLVLARAIERIGFDLVLCGMASTDGTMSVVPAMLAERLGVPQLTFASELSVDGAGGTVRIRRDGDIATETVQASLPAVVSVTDRAGEARYPSFKGIMAAKKMPVQTWSLADLGVDPADVGLSGAWTAVTSVTARPPRAGGQVVKVDGGAATRLAEFLVSQKFI